MLVLASQSPRRKELLSNLGVEFKQDAADIDETPMANENAKDYVQRLAIEKAQHIAERPEWRDCWVLGSDTTVAYEGHILGKPEDLDDCKRMLLMLSGTSHQVYTAVAVVKGQQVLSLVVVTDVLMTTISETDVEAYWHTGEPQDKAGSYGIQGIGGRFVKEVHGSYSNVVGLPLVETMNLLKQAGIVA